MLRLASILISARASATSARVPFQILPSSAESIERRTLLDVEIDLNKIRWSTHFRGLLGITVCSGGLSLYASETLDFLAQAVPPDLEPLAWMLPRALVIGLAMKTGCATAEWINTTRILNLLQRKCNETPLKKVSQFEERLGQLRADLEISNIFQTIGHSTSCALAAAYLAVCLPGIMTSCSPAMAGFWASVEISLLLSAGFPWNYGFGPNFRREALHRFGDEVIEKTPL